MQTNNVIPFPSKLPVSVTFTAKETGSEAPNEAWAQSTLPGIRSAYDLLSCDSTEVRDTFRQLARSNPAAIRCMFDAWTNVCCDFDRGLRVIAEADRRVRLILDELGVDLDASAAS